MTIEQQLRSAIRQAKSAGVTPYQISQGTGVSESSLSLFLNGKRGISLETASKVAEFLQLELAPKRPNH